MGQGAFLRALALNRDEIMAHQIVLALVVIVGTTWLQEISGICTLPTDISQRMRSYRPLCRHRSHAIILQKTVNLYFD